MAITYDALQLVYYADTHINSHSWSIYTCCGFIHCTRLHIHIATSTYLIIPMYWATHDTSVMSRKTQRSRLWNAVAVCSIVVRTVTSMVFRCQRNTECMGRVVLLSNPGSVNIADGSLYRNEHISRGRTYTTE